MQPVSPRFARTVLIPISTLIFLVGRLLASISHFSSSYFSNQQRTYIDALISWLRSPDANPHGYLFATAGTAVGGIPLAPVALMFYRRLSAIHRTLAAIGPFFFAAGLLAAVLIGCLSLRRPRCIGSLSDGAGKLKSEPSCWLRRARPRATSTCWPLSSNAARRSPFARSAPLPGTLQTIRANPRIVR